MGATASCGCSSTEPKVEDLVCSPAPLFTAGVSSFLSDESLNVLPWDLHDSQSENRRVICLVGGPGVGKSALANCLSGSPGLFEEQHPDGARASTQGCCAADFEHHFKLGDVCYRVVDTVAIQDCQSQEGSLRQLLDPDRSPNGIDCFLFVCRWDLPFGGGSLEAFETFEDIFGSGALTHTSVAFTHCADLSHEELRQRIDDGRIPSRELLQACLSKIGGTARVVGIDAACKDERQRERQRVLTLQAVDELVRRNAFNRYNNEAIREARCWRDAVEREVALLPPQQRREMKDHCASLQYGHCTREQISRALVAARREVPARRKAPDAPALPLPCCSGRRFGAGAASATHAGPPLHRITSLHKVDGFWAQSQADQMEHNELCDSDQSRIADANNCVDDPPSPMLAPVPERLDARDLSML